jgi:hypothetical protein
MTRRCPVRNADPAGQIPQAEPSHPVLPDCFCGLFEEDLTKVPVVIGQICASDGPVLTVTT